MKFRVGLFQIINKRDNKVYLQISLDLDRAFNADLFQLKAGMHSNQDLQMDWKKLGVELFEFKILDELKVKDIATPEVIKNDLNELLEIHKNEMKQNGVALY